MRSRFDDQGEYQDNVVSASDDNIGIEGLTGSSLITVESTCSPTTTQVLPSFGVTGSNSTVCLSTVATDFTYRSSLSEWACNSTSSWGPSTAAYPDWATTTNISAGCNGTWWAQQRALSAIARVVAMDVNYCHHHCPSWDRNATSTAIPAECSSTGSSRTYPDRGVDCSNYVSFVYNYAFGAKFISAIDQQACAPASAPGIALNITQDQQELMQPGDLLYITSNGIATTDVSHVVIFTGFTVDFVNTSSPFYNSTVLRDVSSSQLSCMVKQMKKMVANNQSVYVISDSTNNGPSYRPFAGWYYRAFSHVRRVISPPAGFPVNTPNLSFNVTTSSCVNTATPPTLRYTGC